MILASIAPLAIISVINRRFTAPFIIILAYYCLQIPFLIDGSMYFSYDEILDSSIYVVSCNIFLTICLIYSGFFKISAPLFDNSKSQNTNNPFILYFYLFFVTIYVVAEYLNTGFNRGSVWSERAGSTANFITPILTYISFLIFALWTRLKNLIIMVISLPLLLYIFVATGARVIFIVIFSSLWFFAIGRVSFKKLMLIGPVMAAMGMVVHIASRAARGLTLSNLSLNDIYDIAASTFSEGADLSGGDGTIAEAFVLSMRMVDQPFSSLDPMTTPFRMITFPFPSFVFSFKPQDVTYTLWKYAIEVGYFNNDEYYNVLIDSYSMGQNGSLHPILWGDALLNAGWFGVVLWPLAFSFVLIKIERIVSRLYNSDFAALLAASSAPALLYIVRGNVYLGSLLFLPAVVTLAISWMGDRNILREIRKASAR